MKPVLLMDLANVTVPLSRQGLILDPVLTIRNLRELEGVERVSGIWAFADYQQVHFPQNVQRDLMSAGFQLIHAPRLTTNLEGGKATDDVELANHADWLLDNCDTFDTVLLASGDRDFLRVSQRFLNRGLAVYLVNPDLLSASRDLRNAVGKEVEIIAFNQSRLSAERAQPVAKETQTDALASGEPPSLGLSKPEANASATDAVIPPTVAGQPTENETMLKESELQRRMANVSGLIATQSKDWFREVLGSEEHPHHQTLSTYSDILGSILEVIRIQTDHGMHASFKYILNIIKDERNFRLGGRVYMNRQQVPSWISDLGENGVREILTIFVNSSVIEPVVLEDSITTYRPVKDHPFYQVVTGE